MVCHMQDFLFDLFLYVPSTIFQLNSDGSSIGPDKDILLA